MCVCNSIAIAVQFSGYWKAHKNRPFRFFLKKKRRVKWGWKREKNKLFCCSSFSVFQNANKSKIKIKVYVSAGLFKYTFLTVLPSKNDLNTGLQMTTGQNEWGIKIEWIAKLCL